MLVGQRSCSIGEGNSMSERNVQVSTWDMLTGELRYEYIEATQKAIDRNSTSV